jgi:hypothetical protein
MDRISRVFCDESPPSFNGKSIAFRLRQKQRETLLSGRQILLSDNLEWVQDQLHNLAGVYVHFVESIGETGTLSHFTGKP